MIDKIVCTECKQGIKKIVRIYERTKIHELIDNGGQIPERQTLKAVFNTNGFTEMTFQHPMGYPELSTEEHFRHKVEREGWKLINEEYIK
jgi:hypothetical protein